MKRKEPPFRPSLAELDTEATETKLISEIVELMQQCWEEFPENRPDFSTVNAKLKHMQKGR